MRRRLRRSLAALALLAPFIAGAAPWQTLPPTPTLPPGAHSGHVEVGGARLWYARFGHGPAVVLLHGGLGNSDYWGRLVPALVAAGREAIVIDSRGHGRSTRGAGPLHYSTMADDVIAVLDELHVPRADLVGWSDGGIVGLDLGLRHAERLRRMVLFGANSDEHGTYDDAEQQPVFAAYVARVAREYRARSPTPGDFAAFAAQVQQMWATEPRYTAGDLAKIRVPTLIMDGAHDEAIRREHTEYLARSIPGAKLLILADASHFAMLQAPAAFNRAVLGFLAAH